MVIKLIQPRMHRRPMDTDIKNRMSPPLGLYTIANMFRNCHDILVENENIHQLETNDSPDIVGISVNVDSLPRAIEIASIYRRRNIPVVLGGILPTTAPDVIPTNLGITICIGAAEGTWPDIISDFQNGTLKERYTCSHAMTSEQIVSPAYDMMPKGYYLYRNIIHTSRGCPFRCDFCYNSSPQRHYLHRTIKDVMREVREAGSRHIMFIDDNFVGDPRWTRKLLVELKREKIKWNAAVSINVVNIPGILDEMKESGCQGLFIGFESINSASVEGVHKVQNSVDRYEYAVSEIHKRGIMINASFVFGLDSDTKETFAQTVDWIVKNKIETVTSHILTPYPGTTFYNQVLHEGRLITTNLEFYDTAHVVMQPKNMTQEELYNGYLWVYEQVYSFKNILRRMPRSLKQVPAYLMFNFFYRKWGRFTDWLCKKITYERIGYWGERLSKYV
jgi:radical SAM superfamily enzyme YgiQ (UPF0313 family)